MAVEMLAESPIGLAAAAAVANERIVVPGHFDVEVYGTFRRLFRQSKLTRGRFDAIVVRLARLAAERVGLSGLLLEAHVIADRVSATDAFYVALARARDVELLTTDAHLAQGAGTLAHIRLIASA
ncbi:MAG: type II toxin-antitoxin system VapC family toxin [Actinobacteria bacterium]|nr:MAG: type II toxin-antitoxin system VapC family toxin [Actinomycetota bacterium]